MHHARFFNYFESGTQTSNMLDMSQFHKVSITECSHGESTEIWVLKCSDGPNTHRWAKYAKQLQ